MIDAKKLLEQFLGSSLGGAPDARRSGSDEYKGRHASSSQPDVLGSLQDLARNNPLLTGGAAGGLAALLLGSKRGRKLAGSALKYGGLAAIGGLAYKAYRDYQAKQAAPQVPASARTSVPLLPPPADSAFAIENAPQGAETFALEMVVAMINAAKADGHIDAEERARIEGRLSEGGLDPDERAFLSRELAAPMDIERVVKAAKNKEEAVELYAASFIAITPDHPAERGYLQMLAARLGLEPELVESIERTVREADTVGV
ncbi:MAG: hypothetical protein B7X99_09925 [Rhizobiales bacterium 17-65-6]|nr:MAG: hypothetical protein B7Z30_11045 [Rhizobiales bacterium 12-68-15]OYX89652.1 MAG: hypothetical protein B7Y84_04260 [Azorhizobium sp. 32-67-21]OYZ98888.1 MAG: hypothetical protein B7X99_09925 [Rhizobiales bacterium 17-65-6]